MKVTPDNAQHQGARRNQEDSFAFSSFDDDQLINEKGYLAILADGMGGLFHGKEASQTAVQSFLKAYQDSNETKDSNKLLVDALNYANEKVYEFALQMNMEGKVGTTLIATLIFKNHLYWISAGDSRIYLYRNNELTQLTEDHNYELILFNEVINGELTKDSIKNYPQRHALISFLGLSEIPMIDKNIFPFPLEENDLILLCSDGLYDFLTDEEIVSILYKWGPNASQHLVDAVLEKNHPHQDNVTVLILNYNSNSSTRNLSPSPLVENESNTYPTGMKNKKTKKWFISIFSIILIFIIGWFIYFYLHSNDIDWKQFLPELIF